MNKYPLKKSSYKAIANTILDDFQVCRWFTFLILQKEIKTSIPESSARNIFYKKLSTIMLFQKIIYGLILLSFFYCAVQKNIFGLWICAALLLLNFILYQSKKRYVSKISLLLLQNDFSENEISLKTLYQIGEHYGKTYNILTLVDAIYFTDKILRNTLKFSFISLIWIVPFFWKQAYIIFFSIYFTTYFLINSSFVYKRLKK